MAGPACLSAAAPDHWTDDVTDVLKALWGKPHRDILSGLVVPFAMIPEAIAFSGIAGVDPRVGLFGAFLLSVPLAILGGRLMTGLVQQGNGLGEGLALQDLLAAWLLTGILQIAWGDLRLAQAAH
jgi:SulP family sulfate permease